MSVNDIKILLTMAENLYSRLLKSFRRVQTATMHFK